MRHADPITADMSVHGGEAAMTIIGLEMTRMPFLREQASG